MIAALALWAVVAATLGVLALGLGLLQDLITGRRLPAALLLPVGLATLLVVGELASWAGAPRVLPIVVIVAGAGLGFVVAGRHRRPLRVARPGVAAALGVALFYLFALAATGQATFGGYTVLGDTAIHLTGATAFPGSLGGIGPGDGSFGAMVDQYYVQNGYPRGGAALLGMLSSLTGVDPVGALQPLLALVMAGLTSAVWVLLTPVVASRGARALGSAAAGLSALTAGFVLMSSLKEVLAVLTLATCAAALGAVRPAEGRGDVDGPAVAPRQLVPAALAAAAMLASIGVAAGAYLAPLGAVFLAAWIAEFGLRRAAVLAASVAGLAALLSVPSVLRLAQQADIASNVLTAQNELGNLSPGGLPRIGVFGVWLGSDVRFRDDHHTLTLLLAGLVALAAAWGLAVAARSRPRAVGLLAWATGTAVATAVVIRAGSPWADAKALVIASPLLLALAGAGLGSLWAGGVGGAAKMSGRARRAVRGGSAVIAGLIGLGVVASLGYATRDVAPAPEDRFAELRAIDERFAGQGPLLTAEFEEFARHLLRRSGGEFTADPFGVAPDRHGMTAFGRSADQDQLDSGLVQEARLLLVRPGPSSSRPPSNFARVSAGRWYEVWRRDTALPVPRVHLGLGDDASGGTATPTCADLEAFAAGAQPGEQLVAASRGPSAVVPAAAYASAPGWGPDDIFPEFVRPTGTAQFQVTLRGLTPSSPVDVWLQGSFARRVSVRAGDASGGVGPVALNPIGSATKVTTAQAAQDGTLSVTLKRRGPSLRAGTGGSRELWGAVGATPRDALAATQVQRLDPADADQLCGRPLDWLELAPPS